MAKAGYHIPVGLDQSYGDMVITIRNNDNIGLKPTPIKTVLLYMVSAILCFVIVTNTVVASGTLLQKALFVVLWIVLTVTMLSLDGTGRMQAQLIPTLFQYASKSNRYVLTRKTSNPSQFYSIVGIKNIGKNGLVTFADGTYGYFYSVVGSASMLLFDEDRDRILDRVDMFYRKLPTECELLFITTKSAQRVYKQKLALKNRYDALTDPDLKALAIKQFDCLNNYVGKSFKSIHQYMIIKGDNFEMLERAKNIVRAEVENSSRMIRRCTPLKQKSIETLLAQIYCGKER